MDDCHAGFVREGDDIALHGRHLHVEKVSHGHVDAHGKKRVVLTGRDSRGHQVPLILKRSDLVGRKTRDRERDRTP